MSKKKTPTYQHAAAVPVNRMFLHLENPRFEPLPDEQAVIEHLLEHEQIAALAADIIKQGATNPLDAVALVPTKGDGEGETSYMVAEGNRRVCALKLLNDPELAPPKWKKKFAGLAGKASDIETVPAVIFQHEEDVKPWMLRMHTGAMGGAGRKTWGADEQQRFSGSSKNRRASQLLDYCEEAGLISATERKGKLTSAQRFISNDVFKEHVGLDNSDSMNLKRTRTHDEFQSLIRAFLSDLKGNDFGGQPASRMKKNQINEYARQLVKRVGVSDERIEAEDLAKPKAATKRTKRRKPKAAPDAVSLEFNSDLGDALDNLNSYKLMQLHHSLVNIMLEGNTVLASIGVWSFVECLTANAGRSEKTDFLAFLSKDRLGRLGVTGQKHVKAMREVIDRIQKYGNTGKHHQESALFNGNQLNSDWKVITPVLLELVKQVAEDTN